MKTISKFSKPLRAVPILVLFALSGVAGQAGDTPKYRVPVTPPPAGAELGGGKYCSPAGLPSDQYFWQSTSSQAPLSSLVRSSDYPAEAIRNWEQGKVVVEMDISATGAILSCSTMTSSGSASLDAATCRLARERLIFTPAWDEAVCGPIAAKGYAQMIWKL